MPLNAPGETLQFPSRIGLGTWTMGESRSARSAELAAVVQALQLGYRLFDTAELYGNGNAERILGEALRSGRRPRAELFIVSKVKPGNASRRGTVAACEASIERMGCEYLDLYLLHWRGPHAFAETLQGFGELLQRGLIRRFGVSNFDIDELIQWRAAESSVGLGSTACCNQVYYCLSARAIEFDLLPWQRAHGVSTMAYSPLGRGALTRHAVLTQLAAARGVSAAQLALAWCIREPDVVAIPKSSHPQRLEENWRAQSLQLSATELERIDQAFAPPRSKRPLATV